VRYSFHYQNIHAKKVERRINEGVGRKKERKAGERTDGTKKEGK
jgi:hypothetical protein